MADLTDRSRPAAARLADPSQDTSPNANPSPDRDVRRPPADQLDGHPGDGSRGSLVHGSAQPTSTHAHDETGWSALAHRWPLQWSDLGRFALAYAVITAIFIGLGELVVGPLDGSVGRLDRDTAERMVADRTPDLDRISHWGSMLSETGVKIAITAIAVAVMIAVWKRWEDALLVATALILEASIFITVTFFVGRERPAVERLDSSPVDSSFPSGHVAAAVVYGAFAIIVARHARRRWPVVLATAIVAFVSLAVFWSRMYRGMHHLSDVVAGVVLGLVSLAATWWIMRIAEDRQRGLEDAGDRSGAELTRPIDGPTATTEVHS